MKPLVSKQYQRGHILCPETPYSNSISTDIRRTFARAYIRMHKMPTAVAILKGRAK